MKLSPAFVTIAPLAALALLAYKFRFLPWTPLRVAGLLLAILGFAALTVARVQLGNSFSVAPRATQLVTRGLYSRIRNPVYIFAIVGLTGLFLYLGQPRLFMIFLLIIPVQFFRARAESRVLEEHFGDDYRRYKAATWF